MHTCTRCSTLSRKWFKGNNSCWKFNLVRGPKQIKVGIIHILYANKYCLNQSNLKVKHLDLILFFNEGSLNAADKVN